MDRIELDNLTRTYYDAQGETFCALDHAALIWEQGHSIAIMGESGSGKTMITCGLLKLLNRRGWNPAPFKCGPDYIDGLFHNQVLGLESGNLDSFFEEPDHMREKISHITPGCFVVAEGVMGYFDGLGGISVKGNIPDS